MYTFEARRARALGLPPLSGMLLLIFLLAACAPVRVRETPAASAAQDAREAELGPRSHWTITARIAVSNSSTRVLRGAQPASI